jgi:DNA-binding HxlR family transcriptional regulator
MPHIVSTFSKEERMSFWDCKRAFPHITDRVISLRLKELVMLEMLKICEDKKYTATNRMKKINTIITELEKI